MSSCREQWREADRAPRDYDKDIKQFNMDRIKSVLRLLLRYTAKRWLVEIINTFQRKQTIKREIEIVFPFHANLV